MGCGFKTTAARFRGELDVSLFVAKCVFRLGVMSPNRLSNLTIVVVEDHDDARTSLGPFLEHLGANVVLASNAFEGIEAVTNRRPNLVLSDISMPDRDGFDLLRDIRALGPDAGGSVPVVAMTALVSRRERARMLDGGFQACLPKPFTVDELLETILTVIND
jgi:CheY-like chemotaxis protein